jgi:hypothetical protein
LLLLRQCPGCEPASARRLGPAEVSGNWAWFGSSCVGGCVCAVAHPRHRAPLLSPPCRVHTVISALLHVRWLCAVREVRCGAGRCGCPCVCVAGHVHGASDGHGSPWAQPPPLPAPLPADSRWCVVASMAGGLRRATPGAAEVSEAVFLCVVLSLLCRGVWVCGWHPPPPKALCATGPALVHRATHHPCIAAPVVGVWAPPHGMQPCVADVLRCVPPTAQFPLYSEAASRRP